MSEALLRSARDVRWDATADVVVVGLGCAGACAALEAKAAGADVLALERASAGGGTSALSGGMVYLGGGTPVQKACGYDDSPDEMFRFLQAAAGADADEEKIRLLCDGSVEHFHWLEQQGVAFKRSFHPEPGMEPPGDDCLVFSGGEDAYPFNELTRPVPRGHTARHPGAAGGYLMQQLLEALARTSARIETDTRCTALVTNDGGRVVGVVARTAGEERCLGARRGVLLAAGGFVMNREMLARHAPLLARCNHKNGSDGDDGLGIRLGVAAGGEFLNQGRGEVALPSTIPFRMSRGVYLDRRGQRFINEDTYQGHIGTHALFHEGGEVFLLLDDATYERNIVGQEPAYVGETFEELEREAGFPSGALQATMDFYNAGAARGEDPLFHKRTELLVPLVHPPFAVLDCSTNATIWATFTLGGLRTRPTGEVQRSDDTEVAGLYAAGRTAVGLSAMVYAASGVSLAEGTFFGRLAGRSLAAAADGFR